MQSSTHDYSQFPIVRPWSQMVTQAQQRAVQAFWFSYIKQLFGRTFCDHQPVKAHATSLFSTSTQKRNRTISHTNSFYHLVGDVVENLDNRVRYTKMVLQQTLLKSLQRSISTRSQSRNCARKQRSIAALSIGTMPFQTICWIIMGKNGNSRFLERLQEMIREGVIDGWHKEFPKYSRVDLDYVFDFIFSGSMRLILGWIEDDRGMSTADLASRLDRLGHHCHLAIPEFGKWK